MSNVEILLTATDVAKRCNLEVSTITSYRARGLMPEPDLQYGRTPLWHAETIDKWRNTVRRITTTTEGQLR